MDRQTLSQMAVRIGRELHLNNAQYGRLETGFGLAFAAGGIVTGLLADRINVRWLYPALVVAWSALWWLDYYSGLVKVGMGLLSLVLFGVTAAVIAHACSSSRGQTTTPTLGLTLAAEGDAA